MFNWSYTEQNIEVDQLLLLRVCFVYTFLNFPPFPRHHLPIVCLARPSSMTVTRTFGVTVTNSLAGRWALLLFAANTSCLPDEKSLSLEVILNHQSNEPLLKPGFSVTCCYHLTVLAPNRVIYQCKLIS